MSRKQIETSIFGIFLVVFLSLFPFSRASPDSGSVSEKVSGIVTRFLPGGVEVRSKEGTRVYRISEGQNALFLEIEPGDQVILWFERQTRELRLERRDGKVIRGSWMDDRAFFGARLGLQSEIPLSDLV